MKVIQILILVLFVLCVPATRLDEAIQNTGSVTDAQTYKYPTNRIFSFVSPPKGHLYEKTHRSIGIFYVTPF